MLLNRMMIVLSIAMVSLTISVGAATREECIWAVVSQSNIDLSEEDEDVLTSYTDGYEFEQEWRKPFVCAALENNIVYGYEDGSLRLKKDITRAEFACMVYRAKNFYNTPPIDPVKYEGKYSDISDWNEKEICFCIENGYMIGYGNEFGSEDVITSEQLDIVISRMKYGLSTKEKYSLYEICGNSPISVEKMNHSAYNDELKSVELKLRPNEELIGSNSVEIAGEIENLMDLQGNMDYEKLSSEEYKKYVLKSFKAENGTVIKIIDAEAVKKIDDIIKEAEDNNIKRESIFVFSPNNNKKSIMATAYSRMLGSGYEYYCYQETKEKTPNGEIVGKWYKRRVDIDYTQYKTYSSPYAELFCKYGVPEEL